MARRLWTEVWCMAECALNRHVSVGWLESDRVNIYLRPDPEIVLTTFSTSLIHPTLCFYPNS
jgi:hypothetical protein